jgi:hypothetical protein
VLHLISLLSDDVTPGWATRVRTAQSDAQQRIGTTVLYGERPPETVVEFEAWKHYALQAISLRGADFRPVDLLPVDLIGMTARSCRAAAITRTEDG